MIINTNRIIEILEPGGSLEISATQSSHNSNWEAEALKGGMTCPGSPHWLAGWFVGELKSSDLTAGSLHPLTSPKLKVNASFS